MRISDWSSDVCSSDLVTIADGRMVDENPHLDRLERSLGEISIPMPMSRRALKLVMRELVRRNAVRDGLIYMQVTRGVAPRDHRIPAKPLAPALVMTTKRISFAGQKKFSAGVNVITIPDIRWARCDIKTVGLLANCLGTNQADAAGAYDAWQVDRDGYVTEGTTSNAWIVTADDRLLTRPAIHAILNGITRESLLTQAASQAVPFEDCASTPPE